MLVENKREFNFLLKINKTNKDNLMVYSYVNNIYFITNYSTLQYTSLLYYYIIKYVLFLY